MQGDAGTNPKYVCPRTHARLHLEGDALRTATGDATYPIRGGIAQFLRFEPAEDKKTRAQLERLNQLAREKDWQTALRVVYGENAPIVQYVTQIERASFISLLPLSRQDDVLELGSGLGQFTVPLARRASSVCALEVVPGQAEFTLQRCEQEGISNASIAIGGDDCRFPYGDATFDLVVVNLVLEWCAMRCADESMIDVQRRFLSEACRVLKPDGSIYIATKNRFSLRNLIGKPDEHCYNIPFGSALPRWLSGLLLRLKGHRRPFGMLHSYNELKAMLRDAGFNRIDTFWAAPEMRYPTQYVPTDADSIRRARRNSEFVQGEARSTRLLMRFIPAPFVKFFTPGLAFLASKRR